MFAVVDVETTGGYPNQHAITEIGVVWYDGDKVTDRFASLLNPERSIPLAIQRLTGITPQMTAGAPRFAELAAELYQRLQGCVFVAHNVHFDLAFVRAAFAEAGYRYQPSRLCTVRYARRCLPHLGSYRLASLCREFGVVNAAPHRALGDAEATAQVLGHLLQADQQGIWQEMSGIRPRLGHLPPQVPQEAWQALPERAGIYFFRNGTGKPLYIGKAKNLRKRVAQHFQGSKSDYKSQVLQREMAAISHMETGSELMALLWEDQLIRQYWPPLNKAQKHLLRRFGVFRFRDSLGRSRLEINRLQRQGHALARFPSLHLAQQWLSEQVERYALDPALCGQTARYLANNSQGRHEANLHRLQQDLQNLQNNLVVRLPGRRSGEEGRLWIAEGRLRALGFAAENSPDLSPQTWSEFEAVEQSSFNHYLSQRILLDPSYRVEVLQEAPALPAPPGCLF